jgi:hypothetical protein
MLTSTYSPAKVLIVGAGAMGLVVGYHLQQAGAKITFLVRPKRHEALSQLQVLYCYDDATLKTFEGYKLISVAREARATVYDYVIITIDGATSSTADGTAFLKELGASIRDTSAVVISGGIGFELRSHVVAALGIGEDRVLSGALGNLAHQVAPAHLPVHPPTDPDILSKAVVAYRHNNPFGFILEDRFPAIASRFAALYDSCGVSKCLVFDAAALELFTLTVFPIYAGSELMGWPRAAALPNDEEIWALTIAAAREVASLRLGDKVDEAGLPTTDSGRAVQHITVYAVDSLPLDLDAFHAFHHGSKVAVQDLRLLQDCVAGGGRQGKKMASLEDLIARLERSRNCPKRQAYGNIS